MSQRPNKTHILFAYLLIVVTVLLTYFAALYNSFAWVVTAVGLIVGIGQWLLPNVQFSMPQMHGITTFFAKRGFTILITILILLILLNIAALAGYNPFVVFRRAQPISAP